jgi:hypothetical protein
MGLDTTHDCWHGPYSAFGRFREALARAAGYAVWPVAESKERHALVRDVVMLDWGHLGGKRHLAGEWEETPSDPLLVLIVHKDDSGWIYHPQLLPLAARIEELAPLLPPEEHASWNPHWMRDKAAQFVAGLRKAAAAGESVGFH